eukprot:gene14165-16492_t
MDLHAAITDDIILLPGKRCLVPTGIAIALPKGYEAQIRSRSGLAIKNGLAVLNAPGTIDADYRGEIIAIMINLGEESFTIKRGMKIAQMVIGSFSQVSWLQSDNLDETARGSQGFGSTGLYASLRANAVNLHVGPGNNYPIDWLYIRQGMPVEIIAEFDTWRQIRDWQGTQGWVHKSLLSGRRTIWVLHTIKNLRKDPDIKAQII